MVRYLQQLNARILLLNDVWWPARWRSEVKSVLTGMVIGTVVMAAALVFLIAA
jgi:hypothetical protein